MKYTQEEFENICRPISTDLKINLALGQKMPMTYVHFHDCVQTV